MKTSSEYRKLASKLEDKARESFDRCDTDGFLSQWASGLYARLNRSKADLVDAGNVFTFTGLYEGDRRVKAKEIKTYFQFSESYQWVLHEDEVDLIAKRGKCYLPTGSNSRVHKQLGLSERKESSPAYVAISGNSICTFRSGDKWGSNSNLVVA